MLEHLDSLIECVLFKSMNKDQIKEVLDKVNISIKSYKGGEVVAIEGDDCNSVGVILDGDIEIHKSFASGKVVTISHFKAGNIFGEALVFSGKHKYPATIISSNESKIMFIEREDIIRMMTLETRVLNNFMGVLSNRILMLNQRITNLSYDSLRKKIANIILLEYGRQKSPYLTLPYSRKKMAELLNVPRPSLSRELMKMKDDGLIDFYKNKIKIMDLNALEETLQ